MGIRENERIVDLGVGLGGDFGQRSRIRGKKKRFWNVKGQQTSDLRFRPRHGGNLKPRYQHTRRQTHTENQSSGTKKWKHRMKNTNRAVTVARRIMVNNMHHQSVYQL